MRPDAKILVVSGVTSDAKLVGSLLDGEFDQIVFSTEPDQAVQDFDSHRPQVLVLAFQALEQAQQIYLGLYRQSSLIHSHPHRTLVLCGKDELQHAYALCKRNYFDDYILFWALTHDTPRLPMAIHHALRELDSIESGAPGAGEFARQARHIAELEARLDQYAARGKRDIDSASRSIWQAESDIGAALDTVVCRLSEPGLEGSADAAHRTELRREIDRVKVEEIGTRIGAVADAMQPIHEWAGSLKDAVAPQLESARVLGSLAERIRPLVLIVDDDEFQHQLLAQILAKLDLELTFALSSAEAFAVLRRHRPDIILMDINLPDVDGIEVTRQLKSIDRLAGIPVIMITGRSEKTVVMDSLNAGASDFVVKPFDRDGLLRKIGQFLAASAPVQGHD